MKMTEGSAKGKRTLSEKEKLLVTRNFSFSLSVFKRLVLLSCRNQGLFGKGIKGKKDCVLIINPLPDMPNLGSSNSAANKNMIS